MTAGQSQIPVLLMVDAEPTGFFIPRHRRDPWLGFERGLQHLAAIRRLVAERTGRPARFTWLVRADPQVEEVYGSAAWGLEHYRQQFRDLEAAGDEIGLHVHAYRWEEHRNNWVEDYGDQAWVEQCVRTGIRAFESAMQRRPAAFSMGMDWTNQATMRLARELGVRWELSPIPGTVAAPLDFLTGPYTGTAPDCTQIPRHPYQPAGDDFRRPAPASQEGMWIFPLSSRVAPLDLSWKRRLYNRLRFQPVVRCARKFFLTDDPVSLHASIDAELGATARRYLTWALRSDEFLKRRSRAAIRDNLDYLLERAAPDLVFATPAEALRILGSVVADDEAGVQSGGSTRHAG